MTDNSETKRWLCGGPPPKDTHQFCKVELNLLRSVTKQLIGELLRRCEGLATDDGRTTLRPRPPGNSLAQEMYTHRSAVNFAINRLMRLGLIATVEGKDLQVDVGGLRKLNELVNLRQDSG